MKQIQLTINLKGIRGTATALTIAEQAAEHLHDTFNDDDSLGKIVYKVLPSPSAGQDLTRRVIAELSAWYEECDDIAAHVTTQEEVESYTERMTRIKALIKEVTRS